MPAANASPPSSNSTPPSATRIVPWPTLVTISAISMRESLISSRTRSALLLTRSRSSSPNPRERPATPAPTPAPPCTAPNLPSTVLTIVAEGATDQIAESCRDEQRASGVLLDLPLDSGLQTVEISVPEPFRCRFHSTGHAIGSLSDLRVARDRRGSRSLGRRAGKRGAALRALAQ